MRGWAIMVAALATMWAGGLDAPPALLYPRVADYGGVVRVPRAAEPPRRGSKIVFDITAESKPDEVNRGLESVARYLNLHAEAGLQPADVRLALVLHGPATRAALDDAAYAQRGLGSRNPNRELIDALRACGVEVFVCGQSLARAGFVAREVAAGVSVAASAMTVNVNKQQDGYAYISID